MASRLSITNDQSEIQQRSQRLSRNYTQTFSLGNMKGIANSMSPQVNQAQKVYLRLDSPRTKEAIKCLGLDYDSFQYKQLEDFGGKDVDEEIQQLRYDHFLQTSARDVKAVIQKRKELIIEQNRKINQQQQSKDDGVIEEVATKNQGNIHRGGIKSQSMFKTTVMDNLLSVHSENKFSKQEFNHLFSKTTTYLRQSHKNNRVDFIDDGADVLELDQKDTVALENQVEQQVERYNKYKKQKQLEAKEIYDTEISKLRGMQNLKKREEKIEENKILKQIQDWKIKQEKKALAAAKLDKIRDQEEIYRKRKREERERIKLKLKHIKERQETEAEQRRLNTEEKHRISDEKQWRIQYFRNQQELKEEQQLYERLENLKNKFDCAEYTQNQFMAEKIHKLQETGIKDKEKAEKAKQLIESNEKEKMQSLIKRIKKQEEELKVKQSNQIKNEIAKSMAAKNQSERYSYQVQQNGDKNKTKVANLKEKFKQVEQNLEQKKQDDLRKQRIKLEMRQLKEEDLKNINKRIKKKADYEKQKILQKEIDVKNRLQYFKTQKNFLKKTKQEVTAQEKLEKDRIFGTLYNANDKLFPWISYKSPKEATYLDPNIKKHGLQILNQIINTKEIETQVFDKPKKPTEEEKQPKY